MKRANTETPLPFHSSPVGLGPPEMNAHYTHHEIETLRSAIGKLPTVRP
jgi:hypothetical protein